MIRNGQIYLSLRYEDRDTAKRIQGYQWHPSNKQWSWPCSTWRILIRLFPLQAAGIQDEITRYRSTLAVRKQQARLRRETIENMRIGHLHKLKPYEHQLKMIKYGIAEKRFAFFCEMGTGKSLAVIDIFDILCGRSKVNKCLVICPLTVMDVWSEEIEKSSYVSKSIIIYGTKNKRLRLLKEEAQFYIINYEGFLSLQKESCWKDFDMVVLDESSRIKNPKAQRTKAVLKTFKNTSYKYICSGTPITQSPVDIYPQYKFLDNDFLPQQSYYTFRNYFCIVDNSRGYPQITGYQHLPELKSLIARHSLQIKKEDCLDLPDKIYEKQVVEMSSAMADQYEEMKKELILELSEEENITASIVLVKILRLQQITAGSWLENKDNKKIEAVRNIIEENTGNGNQIIIWCRFKKSIERLEELMKEIKMEYSCLHGGTHYRSEQIRKFQEGDAGVFIGQIEAGGMGITLTAGSIVIYYENTFSLEDRKQSEDRSHRIGQTRKVVYIDLVYKNTIDEKILKAINSKQNMSHYLVDSFLEGDYKIKGERTDAKGN